MPAGVSGRTRILASSSKRPATEGAASLAPERPHTPRVRIGNNHPPASHSARAVLSVGGGTPVFRSRDT